VSALLRRVDFLRFLFLFVDFLLMMWLAKALFLRRAPEAVFLNRFKAPFFVFIFGILYVPILV